MGLAVGNAAAVVVDSTERDRAEGRMGAKRTGRSGDMRRDRGTGRGCRARRIAEP